MQKIATRVFIVASVAFGVIGILTVLVSPLRGQGSDFVAVMGKLLFIDVFIILPSFALSIAGKYLNNKS